MDQVNQVSSQDLRPFYYLKALDSLGDYADDFGFELTIPDQFEIEYYTQNNSPNGYLHKIGTCVLESVDVTYGGDKMTWHETNSKGAPPTKTTMALSFKELMTVTKSAIEDGF